MIRKNEKMTLITCTYNRFETLKLMIQSLKNQKRLPDEFIVSDDGSKDDIEAFLKEEFKDEKIMKVKLIKQEDLGFRLARARNNGVREAEGEILVIIDSDIIMPPNFLDIFYKKRKKGVVNLSRSIRLSEEASKKINLERIKENKFNDLYLGEQYRYNVIRHYKNAFYEIFNPTKQAGKFRAMAFSMYKEDYIKIGGMDEDFIGWGLEDVEFGHRAHAYGLKIKNSHNRDFQYHIWHKEFDKNTGASDIFKNKMKDGKFIKEVKHGVLNSLGTDKVEVIEIC